MRLADKELFIFPVEIDLYIYIYKKEIKENILMCLKNYIYLFLNKNILKYSHYYSTEYNLNRS